MTPSTHHQQSGFTIIELLLYIALSAIFISGAVLFSWDLIFSQAKSDVQLTVQSNLRFIANRVSYELRNADSIVSLAPTDLCLSSSEPSRNPTRVYQSGNTVRIAWGGNSVDCTAMTNDEPLTADSVSVDTLSFDDNSIGGSRNVTIDVTLSATGTRQEWQHTASSHFSVELR